MNEERTARIKASEYGDNPVFVDDRFFGDLSELEDHYRDNDEELPAEVQGSIERKLNLNAEHIVFDAWNCAANEMEDGDIPDIDPAQVTELQKLLDGWTEKTPTLFWEAADIIVVLKEPDEN